MTPPVCADRRRPLTLLTAAAAALTLCCTSCGRTDPPAAVTAAVTPGPSPPVVRPSAPHPPSSPARPTVLPRSATVMLRVAAQSQLPELPNGCEVTSLAMLLSAVGQPVDKMQLARRQPVDPTPVSWRPGFPWRPGLGDQPNLDAVTHWGNPNVGFVGNVYAHPGYGIYHDPLRRLLDKQLPGQALDLTGHPFADIIAQLDRGVPVLLWTTISYAPTDNWVTWQSSTGPVHATQDEHAVLLIGHNHTSLLINDPLSGHAAVAVDADRFQGAWQQLGAQALTVAAPAAAARYQPPRAPNTIL